VCGCANQVNACCWVEIFVTAKSTTKIVKISTPRKSLAIRYLVPSWQEQDESVSNDLVRLGDLGWNTHTQWILKPLALSEIRCRFSLRVANAPQAVLQNCCSCRRKGELMFYWMWVYSVNIPQGNLKDQSQDTELNIYLPRKKMRHMRQDSKRPKYREWYKEHQWHRGPYVWWNV
jgi:hypothetical protein